MGPNKGKVICVGLGPGDPELMSVKSHRLLAAASHVAYFPQERRRGARAPDRRWVC